VLPISYQPVVLIGSIANKTIIFQANDVGHAALQLPLVEELEARVAFAQETACFFMFTLVMNSHIVRGFSIQPFPTILILFALAIPTRPYIQRLPL
jgi:hypothetical protein